MLHLFFGFGVVGVMVFYFILPSLPCKCGLVDGFTARLFVAIAHAGLGILAHCLSIGNGFTFPHQWFMGWVAESAIGKGTLFTVPLVLTVQCSMLSSPHPHLVAIRVPRHV